MSTPKFSEVFRHASDNLWPGDASPDSTSLYTCDRIAQSSEELGQTAKFARDYYPLDAVPTWGAFDEFPSGLERQSARFLWLCMLAEIAESEGN